MPKLSFGHVGVTYTHVFVLAKPRLEQIYNECCLHRWKVLAAWKEPAFSPKVPSLKLEGRPWHSHLASAGALRSWRKHLWAQKQLEGEGGRGRKKGKCVMEVLTAKFSSGLYQCLPSCTAGCAPPGGSRAPTLGKPAARPAPPKGPERGSG